MRYILSGAKAPLTVTPSERKRVEGPGGTSRDVIYHRGWMKNQGYPHDLFDGRPVIGFGAGEPDFPTPDYIVAAAIEAFRTAGGKIEVLGVTRSLLRVGAEPGDPAPSLPAKPVATRRR